MADPKKPAPANAKPSADKTVKTPRERFLQVGGMRVTKAIKAIRSLKNIASKKTYDYSEQEWLKARNAIARELEAVDAAFKAELEGKKASAPAESFSFT